MTPVFSPSVECKPFASLLTTSTVIPHGIDVLPDAGRVGNCSVAICVLKHRSWV